jgi:hypothetical protein
MKDPEALKDKDHDAEVERIIDAEVLPAVIEPPQQVNLFGTENPTEVIKRATEVAQVLKDVLVKQNLISNIKGREHVKVEGWTLLGTMLGVFPVNVWTRKLEDGWEARVEARTLSGAVVGAAESECLRSESTWKSRDDYALRSMAQTRATSKALRQPLGFVVSLAGFDPTPAEEMTFASPGGGGGYGGDDLPPARVENAPLKKPGSWAQITECVSAYDEETYETFNKFGDAARRRLFPDSTDTKSLSREERAELFQVTSRAALQLRNDVDAAKFPPPNVDDIRAAWAKVMDGEELAIEGDE